MRRLAAAVVVTLLLLAVVDAAVDKTVESRQVGASVVEAVVDRVVESCLFTDDRLLLRRIAYAETKDGADDRTFKHANSDFYGGIWQVDEASFNAGKSWLPADLKSNIQSSFGIDWSTVSYKELWKPLYSALAARIKIQQYYNSNAIPQSADDQATYWYSHYTINVWTDGQKTYVDASRQITVSCSSPKADIIYVVDGSGSIGSVNFKRVKDFVVNVVSSFDVGPNKVRVGFIEFSANAKVEFDLNRYNTTSQVIQAVNNVPYYTGNTNSAAGLKSLEKMVNEEGRQAEGVSVVSIFLTDGKSNNKQLTNTTASEVHKTLPELTIFSVGVGANVDMAELREIANKPSCIHVYLLAGFQEITAFTSQMMSQACKAPALIEAEQTVRAVVKKDQFYYLKIKVYKNKNGVRIKVKTYSGSVEVYTSWTVRNPSSAIYGQTLNVNKPSDDYESVYVPWDDEEAQDEDDQSQDNNDQGDNNDDQGDNSDRTVVSMGKMATLFASVVGTDDVDNDFELMYTDSAWRQASWLAVIVMTTWVVRLFIMAA